jgi:hypothetical protein
MMPDKRVQHSGKTKNEKQVPIKRGLIDVEVIVGWDMLLVLLADLVQTSPEFGWHWLKPASGAWLPLRDEHSLGSMLKQIVSKTGPYVIVHMQPLKVNSAPALVSIHISVTNHSPNVFLFQPWCKRTSVLFLTSPILSHSPPVHMYSPSSPLYYLQGPYP